MGVQVWVGGSEQGGGVKVKMPPRPVPGAALHVPGAVLAQETAAEHPGGPAAAAL